MFEQELINMYMYKEFHLFFCENFPLQSTKIARNVAAQPSADADTSPDRAQSAEAEDN